MSEAILNTKRRGADGQWREVRRFNRFDASRPTAPIEGMDLQAMHEQLQTDYAHLQGENARLADELAATVAVKAELEATRDLLWSQLNAAHATNDDLSRKHTEQAAILDEIRADRHRWQCEAARLGGLLTRIRQAVENIDGAAIRQRVLPVATEDQAS